MHGPSGEKYLDLTSGVSVSNTGHRHPKVVNAIREQLDAYMHLMVYGEMIQSPQVKYAELLAKHLPPSLSSTYFVNSGSEAVEGALKLARRFTGRSKIVSFRNAYHGSTIAGAITGKALYEGRFTVAEALEADREMTETGLGYDGDDVLAYFREKAAGHPAKFPKPIKV